MIYDLGEKMKQQVTKNYKEKDLARRVEISKEILYDCFGNKLGYRNSYPQFFQIRNSKAL